MRSPQQVNGASIRVQMLKVLALILVGPAAWILWKVLGTS